MGVGILCGRDVEEQLRPTGGHHRIHRPSGQPLDVGLSAVDLPLGERYWVMKGSCRSGPDLSVDDLCRYFAEGRAQTLHEPTVLEKGRVYLIQLDCKVDFAQTRIQGKSTGRSSIGRLDVLVRLLADGGREFDLLPEGASGDLYVEVAPITFGLAVGPGACLNQLRLFRGSEDLFTLTREELSYEHPFPVVDRQGRRLAEHCGGRATTFPFSLDLEPDQATGFSGFVAKQEPPRPVDPRRKAQYDPGEFWEPVRVDQNGFLPLETNRLYILRSEERLRLPGHLAVECQTYTETLGEWRIEYAGFAHPWFGSTRANGTPIIFEVRGHNIPTILRDGLQLGKVSFRRMSREAKQPEAEPQYEKQELKLSSCFGEWSH